MTSHTAHPTVKAGDHAAYMEYALEQAQKSPPKPTNYRVGAILLDADTNTTIATGYTLELPGNTHAEQTCFMKVAEQHNLPEEKIGEILPKNTVLYTTVEPCNKRLSGNLTCVERILRLGNAVKVVYVGVKEPEKFVGQNLGRAKLENAGIKVEHVEVEGMEKRILEIATAGHTKDE
jgi:pyrimidine deaminase RibD-like protein